LEQAAREGEVRMKRKDGQTFIIRPEIGAESPLDVQSIDLSVSTAEIVEFIQEGRAAYDAVRNPRTVSDR
jgi:hypothetical protein